MIEPVGLPLEQVPRIKKSFGSKGKEDSLLTAGVAMAATFKVDERPSTSHMFAFLFKK
jgi:hypothetical protein